MERDKFIKFAAKCGIELTPEMMTKIQRRTNEAVAELEASLLKDAFPGLDADIDELDDEYICFCTDQCGYPCNGKCGCQMCKDTYKETECQSQ